VLLLAALGWQASASEDRKTSRVIGVALAATALFIWPLAAPFRGAGWLQAELPGLTPDATALFTIGLLLALPLRHRRWLLPIPAVLLAIGATMQWLLLLR
jgi:hypothetical protein